MQTFTLTPDRSEATPPEELFTEPRWYACYTRGRHEKKVETLLRDRGIESYLPVARVPSRRKDRQVSLTAPLFPSYVFGRFTLNDLHRVLTTLGVATVVRHRGYPSPIPDDEIENVRRVTEVVASTGAATEVCAFVAEGARVRVAAGPFAGVEGVVMDHRGTRRVLVGLSAIGQGLEIDIETAQLEPLPSLQ